MGPAYRNTRFAIPFLIVVMEVTSRNNRVKENIERKRAENTARFSAATEDVEVQL
jgi:hypothetical protein